MVIKRFRDFLSGALLVTGREVREQFRDWRIIFPIVVLTLFFPVLMNYTANRLVNFVRQYDAPIIGERLIPFLLMVVGFFPMSISLVIALESFVGEKERLTIEPLLCTPLSDTQLYVGKLLASLTPPLLASYLGTTVYLIGVTHRVGWRADPLFLVQIFVLATMQALVMVSGSVVISSQTTSVRAANLLASFIIIPMALLLQAESGLMLWGRYEALWWVAVGLLIVAGLLIRAGLAQFRREELLEREMDTLNLRWIAQTFWRFFKGEGRSVWSWWRAEALASGRGALLPSALTILVLLLGAYVGVTQAKVFVLPAEYLQEFWNSGEIAKRLGGLQLLPTYSAGLVWFQNLRAILLASIGGFFTFGVLGMLVLLLPFTLIGYFAASLAQAGISPWVFLGAFILPHALLEVPAILLAGGAILRMGASFAAPARGQTVGEAWLKALAEWA
ncbi:MAG: stage II sporulation protein M, partial [Anaerolineales bacterium]|nr:stage II sporulation protein M [Anaerolineales bacterium]MDW8447487.1 stage II sporulation protein M [Anaerolineales bacterium]